MVVWWFFMPFWAAVMPSVWLLATPWLSLPVSIYFWVGFWERGMSRLRLGGVMRLTLSYFWFSLLTEVMNSIAFRLGHLKAVCSDHCCSLCWLSKYIVKFTHDMTVMGLISKSQHTESRWKGWWGGNGNLYYIGPQGPTVASEVSLLSLMGTTHCVHKTTGIVDDPTHTQWLKNSHL